jgi:hypothetical protein
MQLVREEFGQGPIQGEQHGPRIQSCPIQVDTLVFRNSSHEGRRGEPGHRAREGTTAEQLAKGPWKKGGEVLRSGPGEGPRELAQDGRGGALGFSGGLPRSRSLNR